MTDAPKGRPKKTGTINVKQIIANMEDNDKAMNIHRTYEDLEIKLTKLLEEIINIYAPIQFLVNLTELLDDSYNSKEFNKASFQQIAEGMDVIIGKANLNYIAEVSDVKSRLLKYDFDAFNDLGELYADGYRISGSTSTTQAIREAYNKVKEAISAAVKPKFLEQLRTVEKLKLQDNEAVLKYVATLESKIAELTAMREDILRMDTRTEAEKKVGFDEVEKTTLQSVGDKISAVMSYFMGQSNSNGDSDAITLQDAAWAKATHYVHQTFIDNMFGNAKYSCFATAASVIEEEQKQCLLSKLDDEACASKKQKAFIGADNCNEIYSMSTVKDTEITDLLVQSSNVTTVITESGTQYFVNGKAVGESIHFIGADTSEKLLLAISANGAAASLLEGGDGNHVSMAQIVGDQDKANLLLGCGNDCPVDNNGAQG